MSSQKKTLVYNSKTESRAVVVGLLMVEVASNRGRGALVAVMTDSGVEIVRGEYQAVRLDQLQRRGEFVVKSVFRVVVSAFGGRVDRD